MESIQLDLRKNPDLADMLADAEPGDVIYLRTTVKYLDSQSLTLTIEKASMDHDDVSEEDSDKESDDEGPDVANGDDEDGGNLGSGAAGEADREPSMQGLRKYAPNTAKLRGREDSAY